MMSKSITSRISRLSAFCFALLLACSASAAELVEAIKIIDTTSKANPVALEQAVAAAVGTRIGKELDLQQLSKDIEALAALNNIDDVQTRIDRLADGSCQVTFLIAVRQNLDAVRIEGNTKYSARRLLAMTKSAIGKPADETQIAADRRAIIGKYEGAGYRGTEVFSRIADEEGKRTLVFVVKEQPRYKLEGVAFQGNTACTDSELKSVLMTKRQWWRYILRFGNYYNAQLQSLDIDAIVKLYASRGYLDCQVTSVELTFQDEDDKDWVTPVYHIQEGAQYTFKARSFNGNALFTAEQLSERCSMNEGDVFNADQAQADLNAMKALYEAQGYLDLSFQPALSRNTQDNTVEVAYQISEGAQLHIGEISISGNTHTSERVIRRELAIYEDDLADQGKIDQSQRRLMNLGYFSSVDILPKSTTNPALRDLTIQVEEKPTGSISLGAAFSTEDSVLGFLELQETNFSLSRLLALETPKGDGQRMRAYIGLGSDTQNVSISLTEPALFDSQFEWTNEIFLNTRYEDEYDERHLGFGSTLSWPVAFRIPFTDHIEYWRMSMGLRIEQVNISNLADEEEFDVDDMSDPSTWPFPDGMNYSLTADEGSEFANRLVISMVRDTRNHYIFPNRGSKINLDLEFVTQMLGSYADYFKFHLGAEKFMPIDDSLFLRLAFNGHSVSECGGEDVRVFDRYFAGGYGTIRGFQRHDVSPVNRNENSIGGKTMLVSTVELIQPVRDFMFLKLFTDIGNVWWDSFDADFGDLNASIGVGVQFRKLPIRLDYGIPVLTSGEHLDGSNGRFHFSIDYSF